MSDLLREGDFVKKAGRPVRVVLAGPSGVGKSTILRALRPYVRQGLLLEQEKQSRSFFKSRTHQNVFVSLYADSSVIMQRRVFRRNPKQYLLGTHIRSPSAVHHVVNANNLAAAIREVERLIHHFNHSVSHPAARMRSGKGGSGGGSFFHFLKAISPNDPTKYTGKVR